MESRFIQVRSLDVRGRPSEYETVKAELILTTSEAHDIRISQGRSAAVCGLYRNRVPMQNSEWLADSLTEDSPRVRQYDRSAQPAAASLYKGMPIHVLHLGASL